MSYILNWCLPHDPDARDEREDAEILRYGSLIHPCRERAAIQEMLGQCLPVSPLRICPSCMGAGHIPWVSIETQEYGITPCVPCKGQGYFNELSATLPELRRPLLVESWDRETGEEVQCGTRNRRVR